MSATTEKIFESDIKLMNKFECSDEAVKKEPMFFNSDYQFAYENGGEITKSFLAALPDDWKSNVVFDSRVHMLMPGWYPAIPGYHHDDVPRPEIPVGQHFITAGQPDYDNPRYKAEHIMGLVNAEICPTKFVIGECKMPSIPEGELIYRKWHEEVKQLIADNKVQVVDAPNKQLIYFDWQCFHTGDKAVTNGWRWFGRISRNTERVNKITNEIRTQVQVYLEFPMEGW
jgi:hypothetical protein